MTIISPASTDDSTGAILKRARVVCGLTQTQVADYIGISHHTYIAVENNRAYFYYDWITQLPNAMRNAVIDGLMRRHRTDIRSNKEALVELQKLRLPEEKPLGAYKISRPTAISPDL